MRSFRATPVLIIFGLGGCAATVEPTSQGQGGARAGASGTAASSGGNAIAGSAGHAGGGDNGGASGTAVVPPGDPRDGGNGPDVASDARVMAPQDAATGSSLCAPGKYIICEDFEATAEGAVPAGWTKHGAAVVASDQAARGRHSLKVSAADAGERRIYTDASKLGSGHWGRIFYRVEIPVPTAFVHSTMVAFQGVGPTRGDEEVRVVDTVKNTNGKHQFLYNVQPNGPEFATGSPYNWVFDGNWHCAEWHIDAPTQSYHFYFDGMEVTSIALDNGPGKYAGTDIPSSFSTVRVGWNNYQSAPPGFVAWIDEVAMDTNRIGCGN
jgi:hypothetical protein